MSDNKKCNNCGELISQEDKFCSSCGISLKKSNRATSIDSMDGIDPEFAKKKNSGSKNFKKENSPSEKSNIKKISGTKLFYLSFFLILILLLIIYSSGIFESANSGMSEQTSTEDYHKGVDLTNIERINTLENELKQNPDDKKLLELAHLLNDSGLKDKAIEKYKIYMKSNPKDADVLVDMGVCYYELNQFEDATKYMKQAISFQPRHQIAHLNLGIVSLSQQKLDEAKEWWKKAIELNPTNDVGKRAQELFNSH